MADNKIFRETALGRLSTPDRLDQGLTIVGSAEWIGLGALLALIIGGAIWALFSVLLLAFSLSSVPAIAIAASVVLVLVYLASRYY